MLGYKKILCALDYDQYAPEIFRVAATLAKESDAVLYVVHVARIPHRDMDVPLPFEPVPLWEREARAHFDDLIRRSMVHGLRHELLIISGLPDVDIVKTVAQLAADLIVMGTHGRGGLKHLVLSSVAEHVIRETTCPVLVLRPRGPVGPPSSERSD
jgi:nucleotide-binding universal stress UspA family protein